jgi:cyclophilin family peptidyl-prolyl cis-trans isomerase
VQFGAALLKGAKDHESLMHAVVAALARITKDGRETSRFARLELLARLKEIAPPDSSGIVILNDYIRDLQVYLTDPDPLVARAAADMYGAMTGRRPAPAPRRPLIIQPAEGELIRPPTAARIDFGLGTDVNVLLMPGVAPLTVARFKALADSHYYDGQAFYKVTPLDLIQIGSPVPNEFMGAGRFIRDEIGLQRHEYGTLGWPRHGPDTGDGQFFVNMLDSPRRNYQYTVFGKVTDGHRKGIHVDYGMTILEDLIEGVRIAGIAVY